MASYPYFKQDIVRHLKNAFPAGATALDVGPCDGIYSDLMYDWFQMEAVEVFAPYIWRHRLEGKYDRVYNADIRSFDFGWYDLVIMGDVLEHMTVEEAQRVLEYIRPRCRELMVAVPYLYAQPPVNGNDFEEHKQPELTHELFMERYPGFKRVFGNDQYGYYLKDDADQG